MVLVLISSTGAGQERKRSSGRERDELAVQMDPIALAAPSGAAVAPGAGWSVQTVDSVGSVGFYSSLAFSPVTGFPAIAYSDESKDDVKYAAWNGASWLIQTVDPGKNVAANISLAFDSSGNPAISYGANKLKFAHWTGSSWSIQTIDSPSTVGLTSLVYQGGAPSIAYKPNGSVKLARLVGSSWVTELVDPHGGGGYVSLAYDADGNPAVAYSDANPGGGSINILKFAHRSGSTWTVQVVESGTVGYGAFASLAYDPLSGNPTIVHSNAVGGTRFLRWDGSQWVLEIADPGRTSYYSIAYDAAGIAAIAYHLAPTPNGYTQVRLARRTGCSNTCWETQLVEDEGPGMVQWRTSLAFDATGLAGISYRVYPAQDLKFAKQTP